MDENVDKICKHETAYLAAQLQQSRIKSEAYQEIIDHELNRQKELIGAMNEIKRLVEINASA